MRVAMNIDSFSYRTRITPIVLMLIPLVALCSTLVTTLPGEQRLWAALPLGLGALAANVSRYRGHEAQRRLWSEWGGAPTTQKLRWLGTSNKYQVERRHEQIHKIVGPQLALPSESEESVDRADADLKYEEAARIVRVGIRTAPEKYPLLYGDLVSYNFRRNMYGLRSIALSVAGVVLATSVTLAIIGIANDGFKPVWAVIAVLSALCLLGWLFVSSKWVRDIADTYADELFNTLDVA